jgi:maleylacetoacetate isomerase/maleylpyruvate isomerase
VPQVYNARRFDCDLSAMPAVLRIDEECARLEAFRRAAPESQPDAVSQGLHNHFNPTRR